MKTKAIAFALTFAFLAGCQSSEEKAENYYQSGLSLMQKGDDDRALIEFRNVFKLNGLHKEARRAYADILIKRGTYGEAAGQYLRLVEQYPDDGPARRTLSELLAMSGNWADVERNGQEAIRLMPDDPTVKAIKILLDYRTATLANDEAGKAAAIAAAQLYLADPATRAEQPQPGLPGGAQLIRQLAITDAIGRNDTATALTLIDESLKVRPDDLPLNALRLMALNQSGDMAAVGGQLRDMVKRFPDNTEIQQNLIRWYVAQKDFAGAEAFLRELAGDAKSPPDGHVAVIQMLRTTKGIEAARAETQSLLEANAGTPNADLYGSLLAGFDFEDGKRNEAIQQLEAILAKAAPSEQTNKIRLLQARLLTTENDQVGARAQVETVLKDDPSNVDALKMRAAWAIQSDKPGDAIVDLRKALDLAPRDAEIMTLMAEAHERDGAKDLAGERLAMAVEVSNRAAPESLRYASFLQREGRSSAAIAVLNDARKANPDSLAVLQALAQIYISNSDWPAAQEIATTLEQSVAGSDAAKAAANEIRAAALLGQGRMDEGMGLLSELATDAAEAGGAAAERRAALMLIQTQARSGRIDEARKSLDEMRASSPDDAYLALLSAALYISQGEPAKAEQTYNSLISREPQNTVAVAQLFALLTRDGRPADASAALDNGLKNAPDAPNLLMIKAGLLERSGDIDGAIATYEQLYPKDSGNLILANNLASLLSSYRETPEALERANAVARRLRGTTVPAFADTYGWIAYRRGDYAEALPYIETAARSLAKDPVVQIHLGMTYAALNRVDEAKVALQKGIDLAGPESQLAPVLQAKAKLAELNG